MKSKGKRSKYTYVPKKIYENYEKLQKKADNHLPLDAETKSTGKKTTTKSKKK